jgi:uncharacterized delta-60 repeat protein
MKTLPALFLFRFVLAASAFGQAPGSVEQTFYGVDWTPQAAQTDGKVLIAWDDNRFGQSPIPLRLMIARLNTDGSFDRSFDPGDIVCWPRRCPCDAGGGAHGPIIRAVQGDGKILVGMKNGGDLVLSDGESTPLVRLNSDGSVDSSFRDLGPDGSVVPRPDGAMFVGAVLLKSDGSVDPSFKPQIEGCAGDQNSWGVAALQSDGRILVISYSACGPSVFRLLPDGSRDPDFHPPITDGGVVWVRMLPDEKILVNGWFRKINGQPRSSLARLNSDGSLDDGFTPFLGGLSEAYPSDAVIQGDGKIVVVVRFLGQALRQLVRLNSDGSLDAGFLSELAPQCCGEGVDLESFSIGSLVLDTGGSFWVATAYTEENEGRSHTEVTRLFGDLTILRLSAPKRLPNGTFEISCAGTAGRNVVLDATSSIMPPLWQPVATNILLNGSTTFNTGAIDTAKASQQFYRAVLR